MPYSRITASRNGRAALAYARGNGEGHNDNEVRNLAVCGVGMVPDDVKSFEDQMEIFWKKASAKNLNQVRRIITSYDLSELDPNNQDDINKAVQMQVDFVKECYPNRQAAIFIQADGVGGKLHAHTIISNVSMTDFRGCTDEQTKFHFVAKNIDEISKRYIDLKMDYADKFNEKTMKAIVPDDVVKQNERRLREENYRAVAAGEIPENYIWKDDLKARIHRSMREATSRQDFLKRLTAHGVEGTFKKSKKQGDYILYELVDTSGFTDKIPSNLKSKSYKLGHDFGLEMLDAALYNDRALRSSPYLHANALPKKSDRIIRRTENENIVPVQQNFETVVKEEPKVQQPKPEKIVQQPKEQEQKTEENINVKHKNPENLENRPEKAEKTAVSSQQEQSEQPVIRLEKTRGRRTRLTEAEIEELERQAEERERLEREKAAEEERQKKEQAIREASEAKKREMEIYQKRIAALEADAKMIDFPTNNGKGLDSP